MAINNKKIGAILFFLALASISLIMPERYAEAYTCVLAMGLPFIGIVIGLYVLITYTDKKMKSTLSYVILSLLLWMIAEFSWGITNKSEVAEYFPPIAEAFYLSGFLIFIYALVKRCREILKALALKYVATITVFVIMLAGGITYFYLFLHGFQSSDVKTQMSLAYISISLVILYFSSLYTVQYFRKKALQFWLWIALFAVFILCGSFTYGYYSITGTHYVGSLPDAFFNL
ncbi:MAG: hypothetical protein ACXQTP_03130, partial [Candidatus Methanofastidiosia archaeon]